MTKFHALTLAALTSPLILVAPAALAQEPAESNTPQTIGLMAETQDFSGGRGSLSTVQLDYKLLINDTTVLFSPVIGERRSPADTQSALGLGASIYQNWSDNVSTRSHIFVSEDKSVFAHIDVAQDITVLIADRTAITAGARWAEYFGGREAIFLSLGARQYFKGGSLSYRITRVKTDGQDAFFSHLVNLNINDSTGNGKTQIWASTGAASLSRSQFDANFSGDDHAIMVRRTQPLFGNIALVAQAGLSSYAAPLGRFTGTNLGLGLTASVD